MFLPVFSSISPGSSEASKRSYPLMAKGSEVKRFITRRSYWFRKQRDFSLISLKWWCRSFQFSLTRNSVNQNSGENMGNGLSSMRPYFGIDQIPMILTFRRGSARTCCKLRPCSGFLRPELRKRMRKKKKKTPCGELLIESSTSIWSDTNRLFTPAQHKRMKWNSSRAHHHTSRPNGFKWIDSPNKNEKLLGSVKGFDTYSDLD